MDPDSTPTADALTNSLLKLIRETAHQDKTLGPWADFWQFPGGTGGLIGAVFDGRSLNARRKLEVPEKRAITLLWLRQVPAEAIAEILNLPAPTVISHLKSTDRWSPGDTRSQQIWKLHCEGVTPVQMVEMGHNRSRIYRILERNDADPNRKNRAPLTVEEQDQVLAMYSNGETYSSIVKRFGLSTTSLKTFLRKAHKDGRLPEYGSRAPAHSYAGEIKSSRQLTE